jgi:C-3',4' desaturase CrtD
MNAEVIVIGAGMAGMATAVRLQARGMQTLVLEAHGQVGGCAGFYRDRGFSFDVGATTLVDFGPGGVGGQFLEEIGLRLDGETLPGYCAWLPDRTITLHRDPALWQHERLRLLGDTRAHRWFWQLLDELAAVFWAASRNGIKLPVRSPRDFLMLMKKLPAASWPSARYLHWTVTDALRQCRLEHDTALRGFLAMLLQDTVHTSPENAPLINGALGLTIRGAGLTRPRGGMRGFWIALLQRYRELGGEVRVGTRVERVSRSSYPQGFIAHTRRGDFHAPQIVSTLPIWNTARLDLPEVSAFLQPYLRRDENALGGAVVVFLGVPEEEVGGQAFRHHQILVDYRRSLNSGNNMFVSVSAPEDTESAPPGYRVVMLSTHCELEEWEGLEKEEYAQRKAALAQRLIEYARRVYPNLGAQACVMEVGTPRTYARYTHRYRGAVGGVRLHLRNSNQFAVPYEIGIPGFWLAGDTTWPGLGTVASVLSSLHVAAGVWQTRPCTRRGNVVSHQTNKAMSSSDLPVALPDLAGLGLDLLTTTAKQRLLLLCRPFVCCGLYWVFAALGLWPCAVLMIMLLFITIVAAAHDLVHQSLGLPHRCNEIMLSLIGMLVLESGHAYKASHLQHHRRFPHDDDPEGDPARMSFVRALLEGPIFLFRLWLWAWRRAPRERGWLALEAGWFLTVIAAGGALWFTMPALLIYAALTMMGSWVYPVATVHLPHNIRGRNALFQTYTLRGRLIPKVFLELTYHLEHHLYPAVPSHHYAELARRLEPSLKEAGVEPIRVV